MGHDYRFAVRKDGRVHVYVNSCPHIGLPLEPLPDRFLDAKRQHIICSAHGARFRIEDCLIVHRVGLLQPLDQIVLVAVTSAHRGDAFDACAYVMDYLKTQAPFWKKERTPEGERWVEARATDDEAAARWAGGDRPNPDRPA